MFQFVPLASSSFGNCYLLRDRETTIMIDCGMPWKWIQKVTNFKTGLIDAVLLSHAHGDHAKAAKDVVNAGIDIYLLPEAKAALKISGHNVHEIELEKTFSVGSLRIAAFQLKHMGIDKEFVPNCGFLIVNRQEERFAYLTDTCYCKYVFPPLNMLAIECNYQSEILERNIESGAVPKFMKDRLLFSHMSLENVLELLKSNDLSKVEQIYLCHLSDSNSNEKYMKRAVMEATGKPTIICPKKVQIW